MKSKVTKVTKVFAVALVFATTLASVARSGNAATVNKTAVPAAIAGESSTITAVSQQEVSALNTFPQSVSPLTAVPLAAVTGQAPVNTGDFNASAFSGKITNACYGEDGCVFVIADYIYRYDPKTGEIVKGPKMKFDRAEVRQIQGGYAVVGEKYAGSAGDSSGLMMTGGDGWFCVLYDASWKELNRVVLSGLISQDGMLFDADISQDGKTLALADMLGGLFCYDITSGKNIQIIDLGTEVRAGGLQLAGIEQVSFTDNSHIAFLGQSFQPSITDSVTAYGVIATDGSGLTLQKPVGYTIGEDLLVQGGKLFLPELFVSATGRLLTVDAGSGKETVYPLSSQGEGKRGVYASDKGGAFATAALGSGLTVRIYDNGGSLVKTETLNNFSELQLARRPQIYLLEDSRICIVLCGTRQDIDTAATVFSY